MGSDLGEFEQRLLPSSSHIGIASDYRVLGGLDRSLYIQLDERRPTMRALDARRMDADTFLAHAVPWAGSDERCELEGGEVVAMAPERIGHARAKNAVLRALERAAAAAGAECEALPDGVGVRISDDTVYEPDAMLRCGPPAPADALAVDDPILVVEVISPSSASRDAITKLAAYARVASIRHYLLVDPSGGGVTHYRRSAGDAAFQVAPVTGTAFELDPPGLTIDLSAIVGI